MSYQVSVLLAVAMMGATFAMGADIPPPDRLLQTLRQGHPRLMMTRNQDARVKALIESDTTAAAYLDGLRRQGRKILEQPPVEYLIVGPRLLTQSRRCVERVYTLATLYRLEGDRKWLDRAVRELEAAAAFPDWNPSHFLDTAEMTHGLAVGYDWLHDDLTADQRQAIRTAIVEKGLKPGIKAYEGDRTGWWRNADHNWNQVCNGGLVIGALAIADEEPELAGQIIHHALQSLPKAMKSFAPDGGWEEGPGYWDYTLRYTVPLILALETALGSDFGLSASDGFADTGSFRLDFVGPTGRAFNYADARDGRSRGSFMMYWLGRRFNQPDYLTAGSADWLGLWLYEKPRSATPVHQPLARLYRGVNVAFLRSAWGDPDAWWTGFKGGDNAANHSHLDLGTFVFDALGQRWVSELGSDDYNLPGYFGKQRWTYYRLNSHGQNAPLIDDSNQDPKAKAAIIHFGDGASPFAVADLTSAFAGKVQRLWRGVVLSDARFLLIQDELEAAEPVGYAWQVHTEADVAVDGQSATLTLGGRTMRLQVVSPADAVITVEAAQGPPPQAQTDKHRRIVVRLPDKVTQARVVVVLSPDRIVPEVMPLREWPRAGDRK